MKRIYNSEQSGRSMVEMLGVLAIIGVLSVAGIAGYSKAMAKYKVSKTMDQVSMLVANIRTIYAGQRNYAGLNAGLAINLGAVPSEMINGNAINNAFNGPVTITTPSVNGVASGGFAIKYENLSQEACVSMATSDWGSGSNSGLIAITVGTGANAVANAAPAVGAAAAAAGADPMTAGSNNLPFTPQQAAGGACANGTSIIWYYF